LNNEFTTLSNSKFLTNIILRLSDDVLSITQLTAIEECLSKWTKKADFLEKPFSLQPHLPLINECFSAATVEEIFSLLAASNDPFAQDTLATLRKMSPLALKITKKALETGSEQTLAECLQMEKRMSQRFCADNDFPEGNISLIWNCYFGIMFKSIRTLL